MLTAGLSMTRRGSEMYVQQVGRMECSEIRVVVELANRALLPPLLMEGVGVTCRLFSRIVDEESPIAHLQLVRRPR